LEFQQANGVNVTHIDGKVIWTEAIFDRYQEGEMGLVLYLSDNSFRDMNYLNWEDSHPTTLENLKLLRNGDLIEYATWNGYAVEKWFCDVRLK
jgi:hypothetical protein